MAARATVRGAGARSGWRPPLRLRPFRLFSVQGKMTAVFLLLTLLATQTIASGLLFRLQAYYLSSTKRDLAGAAAGLAAQAGASLTGGASLGQVRPVIEAALQTPVDGAVLLDAHDRVVYSTGLSQSDVGPMAGGRLAASALGRVSTELVRTSTGQTQIWAAAAIRTNGTLRGLILVEGSAEQIYAVIREVRTILLTWTLVALALSAGLSVLMARAVTGPIEALTQRARAMAAGDFAGRLPVRGRDEVAQLGRVFNHLAQRLQRTLDEIRGEQRRGAAILANMADGIIALDAAGRVMLCNPAAAEMLALDGGAVAGRPVAEAVPAAVAAAALSPPDAASQDGRQEKGSDNDHVAGDVGAGRAASPQEGTPLHVAGRDLVAHVAPLRDAGQLRGTVVVLQDVTARQRLENLRKELVANVSHDLRTPLTTIRLYAETLLEWGLADAETARPKLAVIAEEAERMGRLLGDLLELSELDLRPGVRLAPTDLSALAQASCRRFAERARERGITLGAAPEGSVWVHADEDRLMRVFSNLIANAIDFTEPGGSIRIALRHDEHGAEVSVSDSGVGIAQDDLPRIFDRFFRVDHARSRDHGGSGLGLAIAREIVEAHGGSIAADSVLGQGTTVRFRLPARLPSGRRTN